MQGINDIEGQHQPVILPELNYKIKYFYDVQLEHQQTLDHEHGMSKT